MLAILGLCLACYQCMPNDPSPSSELKKSCDDGFRVENFCLDFCPSDYTCSQFSSVPKGNPSLSLDFSKTVDPSTLRFEYSDPFSPTSRGQDLAPLQSSRGLFLDNTQVITLKKKDLALAPSFTVNIWVLIIKPGMVLADENLSFTINSSQLELNVLEIEISLFGVKSQMKVVRGWVNILAQVKFRDQGSVLIELNGKSGQGIVEFGNYWNGVKWNIGKSENGGDGFVGFLYKVEIFNWISGNEGEIELLGCLEMELEKCQNCQGRDCFEKCCGENRNIKRRLYSRNLSTTECNLFYYAQGTSCIPMNSPNMTALIFNMGSTLTNVPDLSQKYTLNQVGTAVHGYNRGKYLDNGSSYSLSISSHLNISATFTFWVKYESTTTSILFRDNSNTEISINSLSISLSFLGNTVTTLANVVPSNTWIYLNIKYSLNSFYISAQSSNDNSKKNDTCTYASVSILNYKSPFTLFTAYKGWVYLFAYSLYENTLYNPYLKLNTVCEYYGFKNTSCLWNCPVGKFDTGSTCADCEYNNNGCKSNITTSLCLDGDCSECNNSMNYKCTKCNSYLVENFCYPQCPITYVTQEKKCLRGQTFLMNRNNIVNMFSLNSFLLIDFSLSPAIVAVDKGYYFKPLTNITSYVTYYLPHEYSVTIWFKIENAGEVKFGFESQEVLSKYVSSTNQKWTILRLKRHPVYSASSDFNYNIYNGVQVNDKVMVDNTQYSLNTFILSTVKSLITSSRFLILTESSCALFVYTYNFHNSYESFEVLMQNNPTCPYFGDSNCRNDCELRSYKFENTCTKCDPSCYTCSNNNSCASPVCYSSCDSCTDTSLYGCTSCKPGKFAYRNLCLDACPWLFSDSNSVCVPPVQDRIEWNFNINSKTAVSTSSNLIFESVEQNAFQYNRGWYTNSVSLNQNIQFSPYFCLGLWARSDNNIKILRSNSEQELLITLNSAISMNIKTQIGQKSGSSPATTSNLISSWSYYSFRIIPSLYAIFLQGSINGIEKFSNYYANETYISSSTAQTTISSDTFFWIFKFTYVFESFQSSVQNVFVDALGITCLRYLTFCPWNCAQKMYLSDNQCLACKSGCSTCMNGDSCTFCADKLCKICNNGYSAICDSCIDNAQLINSVCQCKADYYLYQNTCIKCESSCSQCSSELYRGCTKCIKTLNEQCTTLCPTFFTQSSGSNCDPSNLRSITTKFTSLNKVFLSEEKSIDLESVGQQNVPISFNQGIQMKSGVQLQTLENLILSNIFTIELWINILHSGGLSFKDLLKIQFSSEKISLITKNSVEFYLGTTFNYWYYYSIIIKTNSNLEIILKRGTTFSQVILSPEDYFLDTSDSRMIIKTLESNENFAWLYQFKYSAFENQLINENIILLTLSTCQDNQFKSGNDCKNCLGFNCLDDNKISCEFNPCSLCDRVDQVQECNCPYGYLNYYGTCIVCNSACETCFGLGDNQCHKCMITFNGYCIASCPLGFQANTNKVCEMIKETQYEVLFDKTNGVFISNPSHYINFNYVSLQANRRTENGNNLVIGYNRGVYLKNSKVVSTVFKLESAFTFMFWVNLYQHGNFFVKGGLEIEIQSGSVNLKVLSNNDKNSQSYSCLIASSTETWNFFVVSYESVEVSDFKVGVNGNLILQTLSQKFEDSIDMMQVGSVGDQNFIAWLYSLTWASRRMGDSDISSMFNSRPELWNCKPNTYALGDQCLDCNYKCNCRRPTDCSLCNQPNCAECFTPDSPCTKCSENFYLDSTQTCQKCLNRCKVCSASIICECSALFKTNYDNTCLLYCSDGDTEISGTCTSVPSKILSYVFNSVSNTYTYNSKYLLYMGTNDQFWPNYDARDPWILNQRGLYFANSLATLGTPSNPISILLGNTQQFELYLHIITCGSILTLASKSNIVISLSCNTTSSGNLLKLVYQTSNTLDVFNVTTQVDFTLSTWYKVTWVLSLESLKLDLNTGKSSFSSISNQIFNQLIDNIFTIGGINNGFAGYLYKIDVFNYQLGLISPITPCSCGICPSLNECLITCSPNTYFDVTCKPCSSSCKNGCSSNSTCLPINDPLCANITSLVGPCQTCVNGTLPIVRPCKCVSGAVFDLKLGACVCKPDEMIYNNTCDPCDRWLQGSEVSGVFSESFLELILTFTLPVKSFICNGLFAPASALKLGSSYSCILSKDFKAMNVKLGKGNTVKNEILMINPKILRGISKECGFSSLQIPVKLEYGISPPNPEAVLNVPSIVYYKCKDFIADGSLSKAYFSDGLLYKWTFVTSIPAFSSISAEYSTVSRIVVPASKLASGVVTVTLTVKNRFDVENSISSEVSIEDQESMIINFDDKVEYVCKLSTTCQYSIKSITTCVSLPSYKYEWSIANKESYTQTEIDNFLKEKSSSNSIKIPANVLPPSLVVLNVKVTELGSGIEGIGELSVKIKPEPPMFLSSRTSGDISSTTDFDISVTVTSQIPTTATLTYKWICFKDSSPCDIDFIPNTEKLLISKDLVKSKAFNKLGITVTTSYILSKTTGETEETFTYAEFNFNIVEWELPTVTLLEKTSNSYVKNVKSSDKLSVISIIIPDDGSFTLNWELSGSDNSVFLTPTTQSIVALDPSTLTKGESYTLKLILTLIDGESSEFDYPFTINSPPKKGSFTSNPTSGIEQSTEFTLSTSGWEDDEGNTPITYEFGYYFQSKANQITSRIPSGEFKNKFPYKAPVLTLYVRAYDSLGDYSELTTDIELSLDENFDKSAYVSGLEGLLSNVMYDDLASTVDSVISAVLKRDLYTSGEFLPPSDEDLGNMQKTLGLLQGFVSDLITSGTPSKELIDMGSSIVEGMAANIFLISDENFNKNTELISKLLENASELGLNSEQGQKLLNVVGNSAKTDSEAVYNKTDIMKKKEAAIESITSGVLKNLVPNQQVSLSSGNMNSKIMSLQPGTPTEAQLTISETISASFPSDIYSQIPSDQSVGISITHSAPDSTSSAPTTVSVSLFSNNAKVPIKLDSSFITIEIPVKDPSSIKKPACVYLNDENKWDSTGCTAIYNKDKNKDSFTCQCNHLSFFSAGEGTEGGGFFPKSNIGQTVDFTSVNKLNATNALGFYICGGLLVLYVFIGVYAGKKDAEDMKDVLNTIDKGNAISAVPDPEIDLHQSVNDEAIVVESIIIEGQALEPKLEPEPIRIKAKAKLKNAIVNHKFLKIFFLFDPKAFRLSICTLIFTVLLGKMYFIGLFYEGEASTTTTFKDAIKSYTFRDFLVMVYSTLIMFIIELIAAYLSKNELINFKWSKDENIRIIRRNRIRRILLIVFCWSLIVYFVWSIAMFCMNLNIGVSYKWIVNTITGFAGEIFFMPSFEFFFKKYFFTLLGLVFQLRFCFYWIYNKFRKRNDKTQPSCDDLSSPGSTDKFGDV